LNTTAALLFKAWRESRGRFLISAALLAAICVFGVFCRGTLMKVIVPEGRFGGDPYVGYIYALVYAGTARGLFTIMVMVLALGGLQRERLHQTLGFTLALPVSRTRLVSMQALLGLGQVAALSMLPLVLLTICSSLAQVSYPLAQMACFGLLWFTGGAVFFAVALLAATLFRNEYTALTVAFAFTIFYPMAVLFSPLSRYPLNIHHIMSGVRMPYFNVHTALLVGAPPWALLACMLMMAGVLIGVAIQITRRRDYA